MKNSMTITMTHSGTKKAEINDSDNRPLKEYNKLLAEFKREQTGYSAIAIIVQSCIGSVAAMLLLMGDLQVFPKLSLLFLVIMLCMSYNASVLAQLRSKTTFNLLILSLLFSISIITWNLF